MTGSSITCSTTCSNRGKGPRSARLLARLLNPLVGRLLAPTLCILAALASFATAQSRPSVVVSIHPLYDLVRQVAGENADVARLLPVGASPHTFDPTPRDVIRVAQADLIVLNGGLDIWLHNLIAASGSQARVVEVISLEAVVEVLKESFPDLVTVDAAGAAIGFNPHVLPDPVAAAAAVPALVSALADIDPANADAYEARGEALLADLQALHEELSEILAPVAGAAFVPFHDAWRYFAARYGLDLIVEIEPFPGREPSPAYLREALGLVRASGATAIFTEPQLSRRPAEVVADEAGVELFEIDPKGGFPGRESYQDLMRYNARTVAEALR